MGAPTRGLLAAACLTALLALPSAASAANQTLTVEKAGAGTGSVVSLPFGIECGSTCSAPFAEGTDVLLLAYPGPNSQAASWSGCDSVSEGNCKVTMGSARKVTATFEAIQRQLTVTKAGMGSGTVTSSPAGIECGPTCQASYAQGTSVTLTGSPAGGSEAVKWAGCDSVNGENKCVVAISAARSVTATFKLPPKQLTVEKSGAGTGTVTSSPAGIACGGTCAAPFEGSSSVTLTGSPGPNSQAPQWSGCDSVSEGKCTVTMSVAKSVTAIFSLVTHPLTVTKSGEGAAFSTLTSSPAGIECGASCSASYLHGTTVTLTATPGPHVKAAQWSGCGSVNGENKCLVTISEAKAVSATFDLEAGYALYPVTVQRVGNGQGTVSGSPGSIDCGTACTAQLLTGTSINLTATPAKGSVFDHWAGGGCKGAGPCTTTVKGAKTIKAVFKLSGQRTLTVQKAGRGQGTVKGKAAGIDCGSACSSQIAAGKKVTLNARPAPGSAFVGWSGACTGTKACKVTMSEARSVTATFSGGSASAPPPSCVVPKLKGKSPRKARAALAAAHCALGKVRKPKARKGRKLGPLVVKSFSPGAGTALPAGAKVDVRLAKARKRHRG